MRFTLIYAYDPTAASPSEGEVQEWVDLDAEWRAAGVLVHAEGYYGRDEARVVRVGEAGPRSDEGTASPAAHTNAGFIVVEAPDLDAATALAARVPTARYGYVEVRRVVEW